MNGQQYCDRVAEVVIHYRALHTFRKVRLLQFRQIQTQLGPELLGVLEVVFQVEIDEHGPVHAGRVSLLAPHALDFEDALLDFLSDLVLHLRGGGARIKRGDDSLAHVDLRVLPARHPQQSVSAGDDQHDRERDGDLRIAERGAHRVHRPPPSISTWLPSCNFCWPATTICSSPRSPERISTSLPTGCPTSIRRA